jgi:hypothetical protein
VNWGNGKVYFFKQDHYVRYDIATDLVDVGPAPISRFWTHLPDFFHRDIDAAVNWGNGKVYFFKQDHYVRYDIATDLVDVGPAPISRFWTHLPDFFHRDIGVAVNWTAPTNLADLFRAAGLVVNEMGDWARRVRPGAFTPAGVMIHHTGVTNALGAIVNGRTNPDGSFLAGPLATVDVPKTGIINLVSGGRTNNAGAGALQVLVEVTHDVPVRGEAGARHLPDCTPKTPPPGTCPEGNRFFYGFENENLGNGTDPWPVVQVDAMARAAAALCQAHGWGTNRVISHGEWTSKKPLEPRGLDMDDFRARVAAA